MTQDNVSWFEHLRCPCCQDRLSLNGASLECEACDIAFQVDDGMPLFASFFVEVENESTASEDFAENYNQNLMEEMAAYMSPEEIQQAIGAGLAKLELKPDAKLLDIACGPGQLTEMIAQFLSPQGQIFSTDLSSEMLKRLVERRDNFTPAVYAFQSDMGDKLPFEDNFFDAVFHSGALNGFCYKKEIMQEWARVVKPGGKIVISDEGSQPWLMGTEYERNIFRTVRSGDPSVIPVETLAEAPYHFNRPDIKSVFKAQPPIALLPIEATDVNVSYLRNGWVLDFRVGQIPELFPQARYGNTTIGQAFSQAGDLEVAVLNPQERPLKGMQVRLRGYKWGHFLGGHISETLVTNTEGKVRFEQLLGDLEYVVEVIRNNNVIAQGEPFRHPSDEPQIMVISGFINKPQ